MAFRAAALLNDADHLLLNSSFTAASPAAAPATPAAAKANGHASDIDMSRARQSPQVIIMRAAAEGNTSRGDDLAIMAITDFP